MKILVVDGQGGKIGAAIVKELKQELPALQIMALGTNSIATAAMLKAGADLGATGENPVVVNCADAGIIIGPLGIILANAFFGEITPAMAQAIGQSRARKILIPVNKCHVSVVGVRDISLAQYIQLAIEEVKQSIGA